MGLGDLNERGITVLETSEEFHALIDGFEGEVVLFTVSLIGSLSFISLSGGFGHGVFSVSDEHFISSNEGLESSSLWVEGVLEMGRGNRARKETNYDDQLSEREWLKAIGADQNTLVGRWETLPGNA